MNLSSSYFYLPPVSLRLSRLQFNAIRPGLLLICNRFQATQDHGDYPYGYPYHSHPRPGFDFGVFDPDFMNTVCAVGNSFQTLPARSRRLQLNAIELAICIFAARVTVKERAHGHLAGSTATLSTPLAQILRTLEQHRKRGLRLVPPEFFRDVSHRWRRLLRWIRVHLLFCGWEKLVHCSNHRYKAMLNECVLQARAGLLALRCAVPDAARLRTMVRQALRYVRRERTEFGIRQLIEDHQLARNYFTIFVVMHENKAVKP